MNDPSAMMHATVPYMSNETACASLACTIQDMYRTIIQLECTCQQMNYTLMEMHARMMEMQKMMKM